MIVDHPINVFLIDDEPLAIEGWRNLLNNAGGFQIVGEVSSNITSLVKEKLPKIDIVIAGMGLLQLPLQKKVISILRNSGPNTKIVMIVNDNNGIEKAQLAGIDEAIQIPFRKRDFLNLLIGLHQDPKKRCAYYIEQLDVNYEPNSLNYSRVMSDVIEFLFFPFLTDKYINFQNPAEDFACFITFQNRGGHPFWEHIRQEYRAERILFSISTARVASTEQVRKLAAQLTNSFGKFAILVSHQVVPDPIKDFQTALYKNEDTLVIFFSDTQIRDILIQKASGIDTSEIFQEVLEEFVTRSLLP